MKKFLFYILLVICNSFSYANSYTKSKYSVDLTHQEAVLFKCLNMNYARVGADLKDYSGNEYTHSTQMKMWEFVEQEAGEFYKHHYALHLENTPPPYTKIFTECMQFSKSKKVKRFLKTLDLRICKPKSKHSDCPFY